MRKVISISNEGDKIIKVVFSDEEFTVFSSFAKSIYTQTSPGVLKKTLIEFKRDIVKTNWNLEVLRKLYIRAQER
jgi:hypothetical protein